VITQKQIDEVEGISSQATAAEEEDFAEHRATGMGCTAVVSLIRGKQVYVANTGDSRCVISRKGVAEPLTLDHKPVLLEEAERIMKAGGFVRDNRVNGALNVSRTIGDLDFKRNTELPHTHQMVVATPDITTFELQKGDEFLILACDGIWDVLSNQEAVDFVRKKIKQGEDLKSICEDVCDQCLAPDLRGLCRGADNMSLIIVVFKQTADLHNPVWNSIRKMFTSLRC
jgi:protein phosphatase 1G